MSWPVLLVLASGIGAVVRAVWLFAAADDDDATVIVAAAWGFLGGILVLISVIPSTPGRAVKAVLAAKDMAAQTAAEWFFVGLFGPSAFLIGMIALIMLMRKMIEVVVHRQPLRGDFAMDLVSVVILLVVTATVSLAWWKMAFG